MKARTAAASSVPAGGDMILNMGQILSIPLVIAGVVILLLSFRKKVQAEA
jgi:prolipoprotein diacylglyceryltransferase